MKAGGTTCRKARTGTRKAERPGARSRLAIEIPAKGWQDIAWRLWTKLSEDRVLLVSAGVTFYLLLALFPAMAAMVSIYGLVADPQYIANQLSNIGDVVPPTVLDIIRSQLQSLAQQDTDALGIGFLIGLGIALWGANSGIKALFDAMNIAYEEREKRGFIKLNLISLTFTIAGLPPPFCCFCWWASYLPCLRFSISARSAMRSYAMAAGF